MSVSTGAATEAGAVKPKQDETDVFAQARAAMAQGREAGAAKTVASGNRRQGLDHQPAWMSRGIGINEELFGETTGDLMKPGLYKADLERIENSIHEGPDPFGDVFREADVKASEVRPRGGASSAVVDMDVDDGAEEHAPVDPEEDEAEPDYDPFSEMPAEEEDSTGCHPKPSARKLEAKRPPAVGSHPPSKSTSLSCQFAGEPSGPPPGPPMGPPPGRTLAPPGPPTDSPPVIAASKSARTKSAALTQTCKSSVPTESTPSKSAQPKSAMLTKSAGVLRSSGATVKGGAPMPAPVKSPPVKMPPAIKPPSAAARELLAAATHQSNEAAGLDLARELEQVLQGATALLASAPPVLGPSAELFGPTGLPPMMDTQGLLPGSLPFASGLPDLQQMSALTAGLPDMGLLGTLGPDAGLFMPPGMPNMLAPGVPILQPLPPAATVALSGLFPADFSVAGLDVGSIPLPICLPPSLLPGIGAPAMLEMDAVVWDAHMSPQGVPYYYCKKTRESRWVKPMGPKDIVIEAASAPAAPKAPDVKTQLGEVDSTETIGKTGWLRVETENGYIYFFHKKKKVTSWECPPEIAKEVAELDGVLFDLPPEESKDAETEGKEGQQKAPDDVEVSGGTEEFPFIEKKNAPAEAADGEAADGEAADVEAAAPKLTKAERAAKKVEEEKLSKEKQRLNNFKQLLMEKGVKPFDKYDKWVSKLLHDSRFSAVPNKERKALFDAVAKRIDVERKKMAAEKKRSGREVFKELLEMSQSSGLFNDKSAGDVIKAMEKRFGEDKRWDSLPERERTKLITETFDEFDKKRRKEEETAKRDFRELVLSTLKGKGDRPPKWDDIRRKLREDKRWKPMDIFNTADRAGAEQAAIYHQIVRELDVVRMTKVKKRRRDETEVDEARKKVRLSESEEALVNFLTERVKQPFELEWEDVRKEFRNHPVFFKSELNDVEKERIWREYRQRVAETRCAVFHQHLTDMPGDVISPDMTFEAVLEKALDPAAAKVFAGMPEDLMRSAWMEWQAQAQESAIELCRHWLRSCEHFRGAEECANEGPQFEDLLRCLSAADLRFRRLAARPKEQRQLVADRLKELRELKKKQRASGAEDDEA